MESVYLLMETACASTAGEFKVDVAALHVDRKTSVDYSDAFSSQVNFFFLPGALCDQVLDKLCLEADTSVRAECFFPLFFVSNNTVTLCPVFWGLASDCESSCVLYRHLVPAREFLSFFFVFIHTPQTPSYLEGIIL